MNTETASLLIRCPRCHRDLAPSYFYKDRSKSSGRKSHCKFCSKESCRKWKEENRELVAKSAARQRHAARLLRALLRNSPELNPRNVGKQRDFAELRELFGEDFSLHGFRMSDAIKRERTVNPLWLIFDAISHLDDVTKYGYRNEAEMFESCVLLFRILQVAKESIPKSESTVNIATSA